MKKITKFDVILNIWISLIINIVLSIVLPLVAIGFINAAIFFKGFAIAFTVSTLLVFLVPVAKWGRDVASAFKLKPLTLPYQLVSTLILALILGTLMSLLMTAVNAGTGPQFISAWLSCYLWALLSVYVSALVGVWTGIPIAGAMCKIPKEPSATKKSK